MDDDRKAAIEAAIRTLGQDDFTDGGEPSVSAVNAAMPDGADRVTAAERNEVWKIMSSPGAGGAAAATDSNGAGGDSGSGGDGDGDAGSEAASGVDAPDDPYSSRPLSSLPFTQSREAQNPRARQLEIERRMRANQDPQP